MLITFDSNYMLTCVKSYKRIVYGTKAITILTIYILL
jgi:hypothetical protein